MVIDPERWVSLLIKLGPDLSATATEYGPFMTSLSCTLSGGIRTEYRFHIANLPWTLLGV